MVQPLWESSRSLRCFIIHQLLLLLFMLGMDLSFALAAVLLVYIHVSLIVSLGRGALVFWVLSSPVGCPQSGGVRLTLEVEVGTVCFVVWALWGMVWCSVEFARHHLEQCSFTLFF